MGIYSLFIRNIGHVDGVYFIDIDFKIINYNKVICKKTEKDIRYLRKQ